MDVENIYHIYLNMTTLYSIDEASKLWDQRIEENVAILKKSIRSYNQKNETAILTR
jgi:hypothetical protein